MLAFKLRNSVKVFEDDQEITLSVGVLENNIITICKNELSDQLKTYLNKLFNRETIEIDEDNDEYSELLKIYNLGFLSFQYNDSNEKILILKVNEDFDYKGELSSGIDFLNYSDIFTKEESEALITKTDAIEYKNAYNSVEQKLRKYKCLMVIGNTCCLNKLLTINHVITTADIPTIFFTHDLYSCYVLGVNSKMGTGCFECFTKSLLNKKNIIDYKYQSNTLECNLGINYFLNSVINSEVNNIKIFKESIIYGNIITYIPGLYQYTFDFNRKTVQCDNCTSSFYSSFEEQNIASMNIIKEIVG